MTRPGQAFLFEDPPCKSPSETITLLGGLPNEVSVRVSGRGDGDTVRPNWVDAKQNFFHNAIFVEYLFGQGQGLSSVAIKIYI